MVEKLCFVIGPIGQDGSEERKHADLLLHSVIKQVLETEEFGYKVKRADEDADPGMIGDRVITDIIHADLVVADLTDLNPNAFYELGIRHSAEKPVIHIAKHGTHLPFDTVSHRTIFVDLSDWQSSQNARSRLASSARAIEEPAYQVSNPITQANARFKMRESADPRDRIIVELQERVSTLEAKDGNLEINLNDILIKKALESVVNDAASSGRTASQVLDQMISIILSSDRSHKYSCSLMEVSRGKLFLVHHRDRGLIHAYPMYSS